MKSVTFVFAAAFTLSTALATIGAAAATAPAGRTAEPAMAVISDVPLAHPQIVRFASRLSQTPPDAAETRYFYAPGSGPRCEMRIRRVEGRLYQRCE